MVSPCAIVKLPMPPPLRDTVRGEKQRLAASYTNFLIGNGVVLVPAFNHPNDEKARAILARIFPGPDGRGDRLHGHHLRCRNPALHFSTTALHLRGVFG